MGVVNPFLAMRQGRSLPGLSGPPQTPTPWQPSAPAGVAQQPGMEPDYAARAAGLAARWNPTPQIGMPSPTPWTPPTPQIGMPSPTPWDPALGQRLPQQQAYSPTSSPQASTVNSTPVSGQTGMWTPAAASRQMQPEQQQMLERIGQLVQQNPQILQVIMSLLGGR